MTFESAVNYIAQFADRKSSIDTNHFCNLSSKQFVRNVGGNTVVRGRGRQARRKLSTA
jgi:hypothetical protein